MPVIASLCRVYTASGRLQAHAVCGSNHRLEWEHGDAQRVCALWMSSACLIYYTHAGQCENLKGLYFLAFLASVNSNFLNPTASGRQKISSD